MNKQPVSQGFFEIRRAVETVGFPAALTGGGDQVGTVVHVERGTAVPLLECFVDRRFRLHRADFEAVYALGDGGGPGENLPYPFQMEAGGVGEKDRPDPVSRQSGNQFAHTRHRCGDDRAERFKHRLLVQLRSGQFPESFKILVRGEPSLFHLVIQHEQFPRHFRRLTEKNTADRMGELNIVKKWWEYNRDLMEVNPDNSPVFTPLVEVFHMD